MQHAQSWQHIWSFQVTVSVTKLLELITSASHVGLGKGNINMPTSMAAQAAAQAAASALQEWMDEVKRDAEDTQRATALHTQQLSDELTAVKHENELLKRIVDTLGTKCDDFVTRFIRMEDSLSGISGIQQVVADTRQ